jgi:hypothetical protein
MWAVDKPPLHKSLDNNKMNMTEKKERRISMPESDYRRLRRKDKALIKAKQFVRLAYEALSSVKE